MNAEHQALLKEIQDRTFDTVKYVSWNHIGSFLKGMFKTVQRLNPEHPDYSNSGFFVGFKKDQSKNGFGPECTIYFGSMHWEGVSTPALLACIDILHDLDQYFADPNRLVESYILALEGNQEYILFEVLGVDAKVGRAFLRGNRKTRQTK